MQSKKEEDIRDFSNSEYFAYFVLSQEDSDILDITEEALFNPEYFGALILQQLLKEKVLTAEEVQFVREETHFLSHMNVMNQSVFILFESFDKLCSYWLDISRMFPANRRKIFWRIFMKCAQNIPPIEVDVQLSSKEHSWKRVTKKLLILSLEKENKNNG